MSLYYIKIGILFSITLSVFALVFTYALARRYRIKLLALNTETRDYYKDSKNFMELFVYKVHINGKNDGIHGVFKYKSGDLLTIDFGVSVSTKKNIYLKLFQMSDLFDKYNLLLVSPIIEVSDCAPLSSSWFATSDGSIDRNTKVCIAEELKSQTSIKVIANTNKSIKNTIGQATV